MIFIFSSKYYEMCRNNNENAETRSSGSVRAILALLIVPPIILGSLALMFLMFTRDQYTSALGILSGLTGLSGSIVGYYFGTKSAEKASKEITKVHNREIEAKDRHIEQLQRH